VLFCFTFFKKQAHILWKLTEKKEEAGRSGWTYPKEMKGMYPHYSLLNFFPKLYEDIRKCENHIVHSREAESGLTYHTSGASAHCLTRADLETGV
jgi:hypothetical protein